MKTCKPKQQNLSWTRKVEQVLRKLNYQRARKHQWGSFWSVGFYGLLWNTFCEVKATHFFGDQAQELERRIIRIEHRYIRRKVVMPA
ncbi:hypothetical protein [Pseudomonas sp. PDM25]|uniref:hypothetical protein n=1 Tax=Pseudomonas sp. PDM25 TaxID=2854772 RepID=UPI001C46827B|nr:hypothetical protein [Pseudomonas sp. PDM25]MBV7514529.1 hypothetical protein [Pseudomonas sp. PDM25]